MDPNRLSGTGVALVTPFTTDEAIDFEALENLMDITASKGAHYYVILGTTGESPTLTDAEKKAVLKFAIDHNTHRLPIVYGLGGNSTQQVTETIKATNLEGTDAILSVNPYYNKPSQRGIIEHFRTIADAAPVPVILYNVPGRTASDISTDTVVTLSAHPNIIGIKEASGNVLRALEIHHRTDEDFLLISGDDMLTVPLYAIGAKGVISVLANAFGDIFKAIHQDVMQGDFENAAKRAYRLSEINKLMYCEGNPVGIKQVLEFQNICSSVVRLPLTKASPELSEAINRALTMI